MLPKVISAFGNINHLVQWKFCYTLCHFCNQKDKSRVDLCCFAMYSSALCGYRVIAYITFLKGKVVKMKAGYFYLSLLVLIAH